MLGLENTNTRDYKGQQGLMFVSRGRYIKQIQRRDLLGEIISMERNVLPVCKHLRGKVMEGRLKMH